MKELEKQITPTFCSESLASSYYFASRKKFNAFFINTVITIDIGGHTSDISIWQNLNLLWRSSTQIAGRHILIDFLKNNIKLLEDLSVKNQILSDSCADLEQLKQNRDKNEDAYRNAIEMIVNSDDFRKTFTSNFDMVSGTEEGSKLRITTEVALSGLLYYLGNVITHLKEQKVFDTAHTNTVTICLAGKTSSLYKMIFQDKEDLSGIEDLFVKSTNGLINKSNIQFSYTENPKHEVSHGLLIDPFGTTNLKTDNQDFTIPLGEDVNVGKEIVSYKASVNSLDATQQWKANSLENIHKFIDVLKNKNRILLDNDQHIENNINSN